MRHDHSKRFFAKPGGALTLADGNVYVCMQWGISNITNFVIRARALGYEKKRTQVTYEENLMKESPTSPIDKETLFSAINTFRIGKTEQSFRRDIPPDYENKYIKLSRIDSANKKGGQSVIQGKQWSIIYEPKSSFVALHGWKALCDYYGDDIKITCVNRGILKGCQAIRFYHMSSNPTHSIIIDILNFIFYS